MKFNRLCTFYILILLMGGQAGAQESVSSSPSMTPTAQAGALSTTFISATPDPSPAYQPEEIVIRAEKENGESWEGKDLDPVKNDGRLSSFLDNRGGLEAQGLGGAKTFSQASIRGSSPEQTLVLLNGQRVNEGFDLGLIPTENIERIEVLKGPEALAYGPEAMGGAINIVSKAGKAGASLSGLAGDFNTWKIQGSTGGWKAGDWMGSLGGSWYQTGGYTVNTDEVSGEISHDSQWDIGKDHISLRAGYVYKNGGAPNGDSLSARDTGQFDSDDREKRNAVAASLAAELGAGDWKFRPSVNYGFADIERLNPLGPDAAAGVPVKDQNLYHDFGARAEGSALWNGPFRSLDLVLEFRAQSVEGAEGLPGGARWDDTSSFSVNGQWEIRRDLSLAGGGRLDWFTSANDFEFNPHAILKFKMSPGRDLFLSAGTGYRRPNFDELFHPSISYMTGPDTPVEFGSGESGNPNLVPESSVNFEAGTDMLFGSLVLRMSGFMNLFSNLIVPAENAADIWTFRNVGRADLVGAEVGFKWNPRGNVTLSGDYTYVDSRDRDSGRLIPARLRQKISGRVEWRPVPEAALNLAGRYADHNPAVYNGPQDNQPLVVVSSYWVMDAGFNLDLGKGVGCFLSLDNILNQTYATVQGLPMPGRILEMGTTIIF